MSHASLSRVVLCVCMIAPLAIAQTQTTPQTATAQTGTFAGHLTGAGMDGATITLTNSATGETKTATSDGNGDFTVTNLTPGTYRAVVRLKSGLQLRESSVEITSTGNNQVSVNLENATATAGARMDLTAKTPTVQTNSTEVSRSYESQFIRDLPLLDRQYQELTSLMPGVTPPVLAGDRIDDPQRSRAFNVNGLPTYANLYNQDGSYANEPYYARPLRIQPDESVQNFEVRTSNYNAEYGVSAGSWASTITRPGTNAIHGSLFEFNTNNYFRTGRSLLTTQTPPRFNQNQFGGTAGGPILHDRVFWFISYEGLMERGSQEAVATVPTPAFTGGNFLGSGAVIYNPYSGTRTAFPGNMIPAGLLNTNSQRILSLLPAPNLPGLTNNLAGNVRLLDDNHRLDAKLDHRFSENSTGFFRYGFTQGSVDQGSLLGMVGSPLNAELRAQTAVGSLTHIFSTNVLGEVRLAYDRYRNGVLPWGDFSGLNGYLTGFPNGIPSVNIAGFSALGLPPNVPRKELDNIYDGATNWGYHNGMNNLKFGVEGRELQTFGFTNPFFSSLGSFTFGPGGTLANSGMAAGLSPAALQANALAAFLLGAPTQSGVSSFLAPPSFRERQYGAYATDTINLFQKLYLEIGVRYDIFSPVEPFQAGGAVTYDPSTNTTTTLGVNGAGVRTYRTNLGNIAPRVGFAFRPTNRFVFRAGYGIHYFPIPFSLLALNPLSSGVQVGLATGTATTTFTSPVVPPAGATAANFPYMISSRNLGTPYAQTFNGQIQGDFGYGFLMDIGYVGNLGRNLPYSSGLVGLPGTGLSGLSFDRTAQTISMGTGLTSNYNSLQVNLTKRFSGGLALAAAYTYSKALDYGTYLLDPYVRANNYGPADWDRTHILSVSHVWQLPFGPSGTHFKTGWVARAFGDWEITGILRWATGTPYTVTADALACACAGVTAVPANFVGAGSFNGSASFNPALFTSPSAGTFGTLSRNSFRGPDFFTYNAALFRNFTVNENIKLEFRGEVYNLTNTSNFGNPVANTLTPGFGTSISTLDGLAGRQFQVAARLLF